MHGSSASEKTIESLQFVLRFVALGVVTNLPFSRELISSVKNAHSKYVAELEMQKEIQYKNWNKR